MWFLEQTLCVNGIMSSSARELFEKIFRANQNKSAGVLWRLHKKQGGETYNTILPSRVLSNVFDKLFKTFQILGGRVTQPVNLADKPAKPMRPYERSL